MAQYRSFKRVPVAGWFPALGTAFWLHFRAKNCLAAKSSVVARPPGRFGKHRIGFIYFSYFLLRCCLLRGLAGIPVGVIDFHQATVRAFDPPRTCFSRYTQGFVMRSHRSSLLSSGGGLFVLLEVPWGTLAQGEIVSRPIEWPLIAHCTSGSMLIWGRDRLCNPP